jgi:uncharacterized OsmC-like protein
MPLMEFRFTNVKIGRSISSGRSPATATPAMTFLAASTGGCVAISSKSFIGKRRFR